MTDETNVEVHLDGEYKRPKDLVASLKNALLDDSSHDEEECEMEKSENNANNANNTNNAKTEKLRPINNKKICEEVETEQVDELEQVIRFNLSNCVEESLKLRNVLVIGPEKSGKKTILRRAVSRVWESIQAESESKADDQETQKLEDLFAYKTVTITREPVTSKLFFAYFLEI